MIDLDVKWAWWELGRLLSERPSQRERERERESKNGVDFECITQGCSNNRLDWLGRWYKNKWNKSEYGVIACLGSLEDV